MPICPKCKGGYFKQVLPDTFQCQDWKCRYMLVIGENVVITSWVEKRDGKDVTVKKVFRSGGVFETH